MAYKGLVTNYGEGGGGYKTGWGNVKFYPFEKGRRKKLYPVLEGGGGGAQQVSDPRFSHIVPPLPIINDQSLALKYNSILFFLSV